MPVSSTVHLKFEHPSFRKARTLLHDCKSPNAYILVSFRTDYDSGMIVDSNLQDATIYRVFRDMLDARSKGIGLEPMAAEAEQH